MSRSVIIVDDDPDVLHAARLALREDFDRIVTLSRPNDVEPTLAEAMFDVVLLDMNFVIGDQSGRAGLDHLERIMTLDPSLSIVLMTTYGGVALAIDALKRGAVDFLLKPWRNEKLVSMMRAAAQQAWDRRAAGAVFDLDTAERTAIARALDHYQGNISRAALALGLTRGALYRRMEKHGL